MGPAPADERPDSTAAHLPTPQLAALSGQWPNPPPAHAERSAATTLNVRAVNVHALATSPTRSTFLPLPAPSPHTSCTLAGRTPEFVNAEVVRDYASAGRHDAVTHTVRLCDAGATFSRFVRRCGRLFTC
jgi:hypothetical protein